MGISKTREYFKNIYKKNNVIIKEEVFPWIGKALEEGESYIKNLDENESKYYVVEVHSNVLDELVNKDILMYRILKNNSKVDKDHNGITIENINNYTF